MNPRIIPSKQDSFFISIGKDTLSKGSILVDRKESGGDRLSSKSAEFAVVSGFVMAFLVYSAFVVPVVCFCSRRRRRTVCRLFSSDLEVATLKCFYANTEARPKLTTAYIYNIISYKNLIVL